MLEVRNLEIEVNDKVIISDLNFTLNENDKMAIIGEEGNGKSTLLKTIYNKDLLTYGKVKGIINLKNNTVGYLEQSINSTNIIKTVKEYIFENINDDYKITNNLYRLLKVLNIKEEILEMKCINNLSGGEKVKVQLLKILLEDPDILLLDEPTNDLDIETLEWLENFIIHEKKPIIFVSHDETLLSKTANMILHLELINNKRDPRHTVIRSTYDEYVEKRLNYLSKQTQVARSERRDHDKQMKRLMQIRQKVEYRQANISRGDPHGGRLLKKKMKSIKAQERRITSTELTQIPDYEEAINFFFEPVYIPTYKEILKLHLNELKINNKVLVKDIDVDFVGPRHIVILGKNGIGKTTLIKLFYETLKDRQDINLGYMPQNYDDVLNQYETPLDFLCTTGDKDEISLVRSYMGDMNFTRDEMIGDIKNLSGGSKAKLFLLKLILKKSDVLLLDEPTRNVSPLSNPVIRRVLKDFAGSIISVSHDRKYISEVCDDVYELTEWGLFRKK